MSILTGAQCISVKAAACAYSIDGFSVIPLQGKKPANGVLWQPFQQRRADVMDIHRWDKSRALQNVGIVCGAISGNLVVMDCDSIAAIALFELNFPHLLNTFTVLTGSGQGKHYYYRVDGLPPTTRALNIAGGNLELRVNGCYVVAPPSIHPDRLKRYRIMRPDPILRLTDMTHLVIWLQGLMEAKKPKPAPAPAPAPKKEKERRTMLEGIRNPQAYGNAAINKECDVLRRTPAGGQNIQLNQSAYNLGQLVGDGILTYAQAADALLAAAVAIGQDEPQSRRTINSGINAGVNATRSYQWYKRGQ
jgi:Bifunctional DNA primase/polymerase, N-terminal